MAVDGRHGLCRHHPRGDIEIPGQLAEMTWEKDERGTSF